MASIGVGVGVGVGVDVDGVAAAAADCVGVDVRHPRRQATPEEYNVACGASRLRFMF